MRVKLLKDTRFYPEEYNEGDDRWGRKSAGEIVEAKRFKDKCLCKIENDLGALLEWSEVEIINGS